MGIASTLDIALKHACGDVRGAVQNVPDHIRAKLSAHARKLDLLLFRVRQAQKRGIFEASGATAGALSSRRIANRDIARLASAKRQCERLKRMRVIWERHCGRVCCAVTSFLDAHLLPRLIHGTIKRWIRRTGLHDEADGKRHDGAVDGRIGRMFPG